MALGESFGVVAPYYNLVFVVVVIILFIYLLRIKNKKIYTKPWILLFIAIGVFIVEEVMTVLRSAGLISFPAFVFGIFEIIIISLFIYMLLVQEQFIKTGKKE